MSTRGSIQFAASGGTNYECCNPHPQNRSLWGRLDKAPHRSLAALSPRSCACPQRSGGQKRIASKPCLSLRGAPLATPTYLQTVFSVRNVPAVTARSQSDGHSSSGLKGPVIQTQGNAAQSTDIMLTTSGAPGGAQAASPHWRDILQLQNK